MDRRRDVKRRAPRSAAQSLAGDDAMDVEGDGEVKASHDVANGIDGEDAESLFRKRTKKSSNSKKRKPVVQLSFGEEEEVRSHYTR